ncbi:MAG: T9SS type A sorting domain-containing protein, partial [bacterium]
PQELILQPAYPNPFNPETNLVFDLPESGHVDLQVFDGKGCHVATLARGFYPAGSHLTRFNAHNLPSGIYFARFISNDFEMVQTLTLTK